MFFFLVNTGKRPKISSWLPRGEQSSWRGCLSLSDQVSFNMFSNYGSHSRRRWLLCCARNEGILFFTHCSGCWSIRTTAEVLDSGCLAHSLHPLRVSDSSGQKYRRRIRFSSRQTFSLTLGAEKNSTREREYIGMEFDASWEEQEERETLLL